MIDRFSDLTVADIAEFDLAQRNAYRDWYMETTGMRLNPFVGNATPGNRTVAIAISCGDYNDRWRGSILVFQNYAIPFRWVIENKIKPNRNLTDSGFIKELCWQAHGVFSRCHLDTSPFDQLILGIHLFLQIAELSDKIKIGISGDSAPRIIDGINDIGSQMVESVRMVNQPFGNFQQSILTLETDRILDLMQEIGLRTWLRLRPIVITDRLQFHYGPELRTALQQYLSPRQPQ